MKFRTLAAVLLAGGLMFASAAPASADSETEVISGRYIELVSTTHDTESMSSMMPGDVVIWTVSVSAEAPDPGVIDMAISGTGELPLNVAVQSCDDPWSGSACPSGAAEIRAEGPVALDGAKDILMQFDAAETRHLLVQVTLSDEASEPAASTELRVHAHGFGEDVETTPPDGDDGLPETGLKISGVLLMAAGAIIVGVFGARLLSRGSDAQAQS